MSVTPSPRRSSKRHPWPRALVRLRRLWFGVVETISFFAAAGGAVVSFLLGRGPEPSRIEESAPGPGRRASRRSRSARRAKA